MIFEIDENVIKKLIDNKYKENIESRIIKIIYKLIDSMCSGEHIFFLTRKYLMLLKNYVKLDKSKRKFLNHIEQNYTKYYSILKNINTKIMIVDEDIDEIKKIKTKGETHYKVHYSYLHNNTFKQVILLGENLTDSNVYYELTKKYLEYKQLNLLKIDFQKIGGGGSTTFKQFEEAIKNKYMCVSIADSDKKFDNDKSGNTATSLRRMYVKNRKSLTEFIELTVRELENHIPPKFLYYFSNHDINKYEILFKNFNKKMKYFDLKKGLTGESMKKKDVYLYWKEALNTLNIRVDCPEELSDDQILMLGFGEKILENCHEIISNKLIEKYNYQIDEKKQLYNKTNNERILGDIISLKNEVKTIKNLVSNNSFFYENEELNYICNSLTGWGCCLEPINIY